MAIKMIVLAAGQGTKPWALASLAGKINRSYHWPTSSTVRQLQIYLLVAHHYSIRIRGARAAVDVSCTEKKQNGRIWTIEKRKEYLQNNNNNNKNTIYFSYSKFATSETERYRDIRAHSGTFSRQVLVWFYLNLVKGLSQSEKLSKDNRCLPWTSERGSW